MELSERISKLEDKMAIQELTHSYLAAADRKDHVAMANHFTSSGVLTSIIDDGTIVMEGTIGISDGFAKILATVDVAYHMAGQLQIQLNGDKASGTSYCFVTLVGTDSKEYLRKIWAVYKDKYVRQDGKWLIDERLASIVWEERDNVNQIKLK